ncbi:ankyrin repeat-containing domain protein [Aspergillus carlsbadensis]|nr:ankyrin repeat-containing domain protein [Aspergillus carlsbadensis]
MDLPEKAFNEHGMFIDPDGLFSEDGAYDATILDYASSLDLSSLVSLMERTPYLKSLLAPHIYHPAPGDSWRGGEPLTVTAIKERDMTGLKLLWEHRPITPEADTAAVSALRVAVDIDNREATEMLLTEGVDPKGIGRLPNEENLSKSKAFGFPLLNAAQKGHLEILKLLMDHNADYMRLDQIGRLQAGDMRWTAFEQAIAEPHLKVASYLLLEAPRPTQVPANLGTRIFYEAVQRGHTEVVRFLCTHHKEINKSEGFLSRKQRRSGGFCRLDHRRHFHDFIHCWWPGNQYALHLVARSYRKENRSNHTAPMAEFLLLNGADVHAIDLNGKTALHIAAYLGNHQLVASLLDYDADINAVDVQGYTSMHCAILAGRLSIARLLLERGAAVDIADYSGQTPLRMAIARAEKAIEMLLHSHGADGQAADSTPLNFELF